MYEKVNPCHPDKIAGQCLIGHDECHIIIETSVPYEVNDIKKIVERTAGQNVKLDLKNKNDMGGFEKLAEWGLIR